MVQFDMLFVLIVAYIAESEVVTIDITAINIVMMRKKHTIGNVNIIAVL